MRDTGSRATRRATQRPTLSASSGLSVRSGRARTCAADSARTAPSSRRASSPAFSTPARLSCAVACRSAAPSVSCATVTVTSRITVLVHRRQRARLMLGDECVDQFVERGALEHLLELVQRQADAMIGDASLGEIVGADALRAVAGADLALALRGPRIRRFLPLLLVEPGAQDLHGEAAVLMLRLFRRDDDEAGRQMRDADGRIRLVDVLAAGAAGAHRVDADVLGADVEVDILHLRQHRNGGGGGVNAPARLGGGDTLHAMDTRLVFEAGEHAPAGDRRYDLLVAAQVVLRQADDLDLPAAQLGVAAVHAEEVGGEQRGLVAAGAGAHLNYGALLIGRVLGEEMQAQLLEKLAPAVIGLVELVLGQLPQLFVGRGVVGERNQLAPLGLGLAVLADCVDDRIQLRELLRQLHAGRLIDALTELGLERCPALNELVELLGGDGCHGKDIRARRSKRKTGVRAARAPAATFATLTGARVQLAGFAQPRIAHFDPPQTIAVRRRDERDIVQAGTRSTPDRIRQQSDGAIH